MSLYSRARKHIDMNRVKELREEKLKEKKIADILRQQDEILIEMKKIEIKEDPKYSNWRREINEDVSEITEGMTTASLGMINLPAAGDIDIIDTDTTFDNINSSISQTDNISRSGTTITLQGTENQIVGGTHTAYNVARFEVDGTRVSHVKITISKGGGTSSWTDRDGASNFDDSVTLNITDADNFFAPGYNSTNLTSGTHIIPVPGNYTNLRISFEQFAKVGETGALTISNVSLQRRTPVSVVVPLDDPEANAFIRGGLGGDKERRKQLKDMLDAGNQWMYIRGLEPSKTSPGDIELDKVDTGKDYGEIAGSLSGPRNSPGPGVPRDSPRGPYTPLKNYGTDKNPKLMPSGPSVNPWRLA